MDQIRVFSIYPSLSGEVGDCLQGQPAVFVRLAGCNLRCYWCDSEKTQSAGSGALVSIDSVVESVVRLGCRNVIITGGEPLLQASAVTALASALKGKDSRFRVSVETNGSVPLPSSSYDVDCFVIDSKPASSGASEYMLSARKLFSAGFYGKVVIKFPIGSVGDFLDSLKVMEEFMAHNRKGLLYAFSPIMDLLPPSTLASYMRQAGLFERSDVVLSLQLHKVIWPDSEEEV